MIENVVISLHRLKSDDMARHGLMMVFFGVLTSFFFYLYQLSMGMLLAPNGYRILYSLLSLFVIISVFSRAAQISVAKFISKTNAQGKLGGVNYLWQFFLKRSFLLGLGVFLVLLCLTPFISKFLNIDNNLYSVIVFSSFIFVFALPTNQGVLQGLQRFVPLGSSNALWAFSRVFFGVVLILLGLGLHGGLISLPLSFLFAFLFTLFFVKDLSKCGNEKVETGGLGQYSGLTLLALLAFTALINIDMVLAGHYFSPETAGNYAGLSVLGKVALYAPMGVAAALFPKSSGAFEIGGEHRPLLHKAMALCLVLASGVVIIYAIFPEFIVNLLFHGKYLAAIPYLFRYALAMAALALSSLLLNYFLSINQTKLAYPLLGAVALEMGLMALFHSNISQFVNIVLGTSIASLLVMFPFYLKTRNASGSLPSNEGFLG